MLLHYYCEICLYCRLLNIIMQINHIRPKKSLMDAQAFFLGPVVQSVVSLTSSLRVVSLTVLADSIYNTMIFFTEKM